MSNKKARERASKELTDFLLKTRKDRNYTLQQAAYKTGLSHTYISQLERGLRATPVPEDLRKIAKGFRVDYNFLMSLAGYIDKVDQSQHDPNGVLMFSDQESFNELPKEQQDIILNSLREQADFMIEKYKRGNK
ncbi:helix-turn-helix domain-containing protein [Staphylococcus haemolyticus]|uniref:helix-turn-helix domain-containing protein n=1 Tax=Staphylococcus TaxID=1279 RepID=UPI000CEB44A1|nr:MULTISPECIES: helix-turn-helix transcriptional regulator [Staphylococcus]AVH47415.1 helix-turn-helix domain-containing protein [Staphylococcus haemolyticus]KAA2278060.1 helix-turn-helix domain-containing protein [Staphylococcus sp. GDX7P312P]KAA2281503.1 helix-turn-helix domain-containing protein [Staphylococcus sp. GDX7P459A]MCH4482880.1 helix-turn-helix domain-containing protein [Staphylococcus haemolyticus]MEB5827171.1 helix-turn-helix domain-containing protein [Staphylococcus haemolytic